MEAQVSPVEWNPPVFVRRRSSGSGKMLYKGKRMVERVRDSRVVRGTMRGMRAAATRASPVVSKTVRGMHTAGRSVGRAVGAGANRVERLIRELERKGFHVIGLLIPLIYYVGLKTGTLSRISASLVLGILVTGIFTGEFLRLRWPALNRLVVAAMGPLLRKEEHEGKMSGMPWYMLGCFLSIFLFHPLVAMVAIAFLIFGDYAAALVGTAFGVHKIPGSRKSFEGCLGCFVTCFVVGCSILALVPSTRPVQVILISIISALVATIAELSEKVNDNLSIPLCTGVTIHNLLNLFGVPIILP